MNLQFLIINDNSHHTHSDIFVVYIYMYYNIYIYTNIYCIYMHYTLLHVGSMLINVYLSVISELYGWGIIEASIWMSELKFDNYVVDEWCENVISITL